MAGRGRAGTGRRGHTVVGEYLPAVVVFVGAVALWEAFVFVFKIQFYLLPAPHVIIETFRGQAAIIIEAGLYTFREALIGYGLGCGFGILAAVAASRTPGFADLVLPYAIASASVPIIALAPVAIVWFGIDQGSKIAIVALMTFFPMFISTLRGLLHVTPQSLELMRSYAAGGGQVFRKLRLPASLPFMFNALKLGTTLAMIGAVVSEYFGGRVKSLGVYIVSNASLNRTREAWSGILVACALSLTFYLAVVLVERLVMPWHTSTRKT
jgi:NitT/TauT family transport system permease protein